MTSLLREEVSKPICQAWSSTITSRPASASARATASPTTPAPTTMHSMSFMAASLTLFALFRPGRTGVEEGDRRDAHLRARVLHLARIGDIDQRVVLRVVDAAHREHLEDQAASLGEHLLALLAQVDVADDDRRGLAARDRAVRRVLEPVAL